MSRAVRERLDELDGLRAIALLAVVLLHSLAWIVTSTVPAYEGIPAALLDLSRFCVPAFVFASGLVLYWSHGAGVEPRSFLARRWSRVALPWLIWTPVFALLGLYFGAFPGGWWNFAAWVAYGAGHLYFLILIAQLYVVYLFIPAPGPRLVVFTAAALALQLGLGFYRTYLPQLQGPLNWPGSQLALEEAPFYVGYFAAGCLAAAHWRRLVGLSRYWPAALAVALLSTGAFLAESLTVSTASWRHGTYTFLWPAEIPLTLSISLAVLWMARTFQGSLGRAWPAVAWVSRHSLGLYIVHPVFMNLLGPHLGGIGPVPRVATLFVFSLVCAALTVVGLTRHRWTALSIGEAVRSRRPPRRRVPA
ncbi:MAG: acyltransferase, partial [Candidatus Dormibacteraceae bacterium]